MPEILFDLFAIPLTIVRGGPDATIEREKNDAEASKERVLPNQHCFSVDDSFIVSLRMIRMDIRIAHEHSLPRLR
jgi:hypothetical protein